MAMHAFSVGPRNFRFWPIAEARKLTTVRFSKCTTGCNELGCRRR